MKLGLFTPALALAAIFSAQADDTLPRSAGQLLEQRSEMGPGVDMFARRSWAPPPPKPKPAARQQTLAPPPKPPALPFAYGGSGAVNGTPVLFLERRNESVMVRAGDVLDSYRVEAIQAGRAILRYLPLDMVQVMMFGSPGVLAEAAQVARGPLILQVPDEVPLGQEVPVALGIPPGSAATRATIELTYDAEALAISGARIVRPGHARVEVSAQDPAPPRLRLKPIAEETVLTEIGIAVLAFDAQGRSVEVRLPSQHTISVVEPRKSAL